MASSLRQLRHVNLGQPLEVHVLRVEGDGAAQMGFCFLGASKIIENRAKVRMLLREIRGLLYCDAGCGEGFLIPFLLIQDVLPKL